MPYAQVTITMYIINSYHMTVRQQNTMGIFASNIGIITINIAVTILDNLLLMYVLLMTPSGKHSTNFSYCKYMCQLVHYSLLVLR